METRNGGKNTTSTSVTKVELPLLKTPVEEANKSSNDDDDSFDIENIVCCICHCKVDFSEQQCFGEKEVNKNDETKVLLKGLPRHLYDDNNAILLCDEPGCDRAYHQRCHFTPVFCVPRGNWTCLICQYKKQIKQTTKRKTKTNSKTKSVMTRAELDSIFRVHSSSCQPSSNIQQQDKMKNLFEYVTSTLKATVLQKELENRIKSSLDHSLGKIRQAQNTIRAYLETNRARKDIISNYQITGRLQQELVQSLLRISQGKLRIRKILMSLQKFIQNYDEVPILEKWLLDQSPPPPPQQQQMVQNCNKKMKEMESNDDLSLSNNNNVGDSHELIMNGMECKRNPSYLIPITTYSLRENLFLSSVGCRRIEPRFDIKDYDGSINGSSEEEDRMDKIKCAVCFSGEVGKDNDVLMCDGEHCFRAFHMKCVSPHVTQKMLDDDVNGTWFCPLCTALATHVHHVQVEYEGDEWEILQTNKKSTTNQKTKKEENDDDASNSSWNNASDVFVEAEVEYETAKKLEQCRHDDVTDQFLCSLVGIPIERDNDETTMLNDDEDEDDEDFDKDYNNSNSNIIYENSSSEEVSSIEWNVQKGEIDALSSCSSSLDDNSDHDDNDNNNEKKGKIPTKWLSLKKRRRRRQQEQEQNKDESENSSSENENPRKKKSLNDGTVDASNIIVGKRNRTKVDYRRYDVIISFCID